VIGPVEHWERIIELEIDYYLSVKNHENELLDRYYESQLISIPSTLFLENEGIMCIRGRSVEDQVIYKLEMKERIEGLLNQVIKRINRLSSSFKHLTKDEMHLISIYYLEDSDLSDKQMAKTLGYLTTNEFLKKKNLALKKLYRWYVQDREQAVQALDQAAKDETKRKAMQWLYCMDDHNDALIKAKAEKDAREYLREKYRSGCGYLAKE
jgi:hypothetical protein